VRRRPGRSTAGCSDLEELAARLRTGGVDATYDETIPDVRRFHVADPFGNRLEFREPL
jgi:hypothetical protein